MNNEYDKGYKDGVCAGELIAIVRIKKGVKKYIKNHKDLKDIEGDLVKIIMGEKL